MSIFSPDKLPQDSSLAEFKRDARATLDAYAAFLKSPAFQHNIDLAVLTKIAGDEAVPFRERRRAAEVLARLRLQAMEALADLSAVREQVKRELGLEDAPKAVSLTQVNQKIEIVRSDDWRATDAEIVDAELEGAPEEAPTDGRADDP